MRFRGRFLARLMLLVVMIALAGWIVMRLWNWVVPGVFVDAHPIDYSRAIGLLVLCRILFGGFRGFGGYGRCRGRRWNRMTAEEREQLRRGMQERRAQ
jgi:hypothetical protein